MRGGLISGLLDRLAALFYVFPETLHGIAAGKCGDQNTNGQD
jgi:hypothetical protein